MKKAQIRIGETISVLFIFLVIVILGFTFYIRIQRTTIEGDIERTSDARAIEITQMASFISALQCSSKNIVTNNCFDIMKLESFSAVVERNKNYFFDEFLYSTLEVEKIYPDKSYWLIYNNTPGDTTALFTAVPILLYNATEKKYNAGILKVTYYPFAPVS